VTLSSLPTSRPITPRSAIPYSLPALAAPLTRRSTASQRRRTIWPAYWVNSLGVCSNLRAILHPSTRTTVEPPRRISETGRRKVTAWRRITGSHWALAPRLKGTCSLAMVPNSATNSGARRESQTSARAILAHSHVFDDAIPMGYHTAQRSARWFAGQHTRHYTMIIPRHPAGIQVRNCPKTAHPTP